MMKDTVEILGKTYPYKEIQNAFKKDVATNDISLARKYLSKATNAKETGVEFNISLTSFKNLMRSKKCKYTGIKLTESRYGKNVRGSDRTVERIDSNLGYIPGNVVAVCHTANSLKALWENPNNELTFSLVCKMVKLIKKHNKKNYE